jgi:hypothetical protein
LRNKKKPVNICSKKHLLFALYGSENQPFNL